MSAGTAPLERGRRHDLAVVVNATFPGDVSGELDDPIESCRLAAAALRSAARLGYLRVAIPLDELREISERLCDVTNSLYDLSTVLSEQSLHREEASDREQRGTETPLTHAVAAVAGLHGALGEASVHASKFRHALVRSNGPDTED